MRPFDPRNAAIAAVLLWASATAAEPASTETAPVPFPDAATRAWQVGLLRPDRLQHFTFGFTTGVMVGLTSREPIAAVTSGAALGIAKELWDLRGGRFDMLDLGATLLGTAAAASVTITMTH